MRMAEMFQKGIRYLKDESYRFTVDSFYFGRNHKMPDEEYLQRLFKMTMGYELDLEHPKTFNEKLQWLKIHDRRPEYTMMVDKYEVKQYVADCIGKQYVIPTLGVWNCFDEIDFDILPNQFALKCTHDSGGGTICKDKSTWDWQAAKKNWRDV